MNKIKDKTNKLFDMKHCQGVVNVPKDFYNAISRCYQEDKSAVIGEVHRHKDKTLKFSMANTANKEYELNLEKVNTPYVIFMSNNDTEDVKMMNKPNVRGTITLAEFKPEKIVARFETKIMEKEIRLDRLPKARINLKDSENLAKREKLEPHDLKKELFQHFEESEEMTFAEINNEVDQPVQYLTNILDEICLKRKERNKYVYYLKSEYKFNDGSDPKKKLKK